MKDLLSYILQSILEEHTNFTVEEEETEGGLVTFNVSLPKEQMGRVIGKGGKMIHAIKTILKVRAAKEEKRVDITLLEQ